MIAAGVLAYILNHLLRPDGWAEAPKSNPQPTV